VPGHAAIPARRSNSISRSQSTTRFELGTVGDATPPRTIALWERLSRPVVATGFHEIQWRYHWVSAASWTGLRPCSSASSICRRLRPRGASSSWSHARPGSPRCSGNHSPPPCSWTSKIRRRGKVRIPLGTPTRVPSPQRWVHALLQERKRVIRGCRGASARGRHSDKRSISTTRTSRRASRVSGVFLSIPPAAKARKRTRSPSRPKPDGRSAK